MRLARGLRAAFSVYGEGGGQRSRFYLKPLAFYSKEVLLSINVAKAAVVERTQSANTLRPGFYLIDFNQLDPTTKQIVPGPRMRRNFLLDARKAVGLLQCPTGPDTHFRVEFQSPREGKFLQVFKEVSEEAVRLSYFLQEGGEFTENLSTQLTPAEFYLLQRFIDYTLPHAFGWDAINQS